MYPMEPRPVTVERRFAELRNPAVWNASVVDTMDDVKEAVEIYPIDPRPVTVEVKLLVIAIPATVDAILEASSVGSMNVLI